jgi:23S rRNA (guanosine2251-2'-O)-methyltransferase
MSEVLYGRQPVLEVLRAGKRQIRSVSVADVKKSGEIDEIFGLAKKAGVQVGRIDRNTLDRFCEGGHHQGVCIEVSAFPTISEGELVSLAAERGKDGVFLFLDHIQDPQNTGALIRSAECLGIDAVVVPADRAVGITPSVVRASAGATEHMNIAVVVNLVRTMKKLKDSGLWFYGLEAGEGSEPLRGMEFNDAVGLVVGSEGKGMTRLVKETCDFTIEIPMTGRVSSLNASVSGGIVMFEVVSQKRAAAQ